MSVKYIKILFIVILYLILSACETPSEYWLNENQYKYYEITLLDGSKETVKARKCRGFIKNKKGNDNPVYEIQCSNDGYDWWSIYNAIGTGIKTIENEQ